MTSLLLDTLEVVMRGKGLVAFNAQPTGEGKGSNIMTSSWLDLLTL